MRGNVGQRTPAAAEMGVMPIWDEWQRQGKERGRKSVNRFLPSTLRVCFKCNFGRICQTSGSPISLNYLQIQLFAI